MAAGKSRSAFETYFNDASTGKFRNGQAAGAITEAVDRDRNTVIKESAAFMEDFLPFTTGGTTTAYTITTGAYGATKYTRPFFIKMNATNTGACTLNPDGGGAKSLKKRGTDDLIAGDLKINGVYQVVYDGTNFQVLNIVAESNFIVSATSTVANTGIALLENLALSADADITITSGDQGGSGNIYLENLGISGDLELINDAGNISLETTNDIVIPGFAGGGVQFLTVDNDGVVTLNGGSSPAASNGSYTPILTDVTNVASHTVYDLHYARVGDGSAGTVETIAGRIGVTPTAAIATEIDVSLHTASDFSAAGDVGGGGCIATTVPSYLAPYIIADVTNNRIRIFFIAANTSAHDISFTATYRVR